MWIIRMRFNLKTLIVVKKQINKSISDCFFVSFGCYVSVIVYYFIYFCAFYSNKWRINSNGWRRRVFCAGTRSRRWLDTSAQVGWRRRICTNFIHRPTYIRPVMNSFTDYASDYHLYVFETSWVSSSCVTQSILQTTVLIFQLTFVCLKYLRFRLRFSLMCGLPNCNSGVISWMAIQSILEKKNLQLSSYVPLNHHLINLHKPMGW